MSEEVRIPILHHVNLKTSRLQEMIDWYGVVAGLKPTFRFPGGAFLTNDAANHRLALTAAPHFADDPDFRRRSGLHHVGFEYASLEDLLLSFKRLEGIGIVPHLTLDHGSCTSFYYVDPDGNSVELQADNFSDWEKSLEFIRTSPGFAANPIGVPVNPSLMLQALEAGQSADEIQRRGYAGEFPPVEPMDPRMDA